MIKNTEIAYAEVDEILDLLDDEFIDKVPKNVRDFFKEEKDKECIVNIDIDKPLYEQDLQDETISLLTLLELNYWCESEEEKNSILKELEQNDEIKEKELREKYNTDNIFKNKQSVVSDKNIEQISLVKYKEEGFIRKILSKIQKFFRRNSK